MRLKPNFPWSVDDELPVCDQPLEHGGSSDRVEIRLCWNIIPDGDHFFIVEEEFDNHPVRRWGPVPTRESAHALIQERLRQPNLLQDALKQQK